MKTQRTNGQLSWNPLLAFTGIYVVCIATAIVLCICLTNYYQQDQAATNNTELAMNKK